MGNEIKLDTVKMENKKQNIDGLIKSMEDYATESETLTFGAKSAGDSTGPCSDAMADVNHEMYMSISAMVAMMKDLKEYIRNGSEKLEEADKFFAEHTVSVNYKVISTGE